MNELVQILTDLGPWGLVLLVGIYILLKGRLRFQYPAEGPSDPGPPPSGEPPRPPLSG